MHREVRTFTIFVCLPVYSDFRSPRKEDESSRSVCNLETGMMTDNFSGINLNAEIKNHEIYSFLFQTLKYIPIA